RRSRQASLTRSVRLEIESWSALFSRIPGNGATWRSGYATVCKTVYSGSIPDVASIFNLLISLELRSGPGSRTGFARRSDEGSGAGPAEVLYNGHLQQSGIRADGRTSQTYRYLAGVAEGRAWPRGPRDRRRHGSPRDRAGAGAQIAVVGGADLDHRHPDERGPLAEGNPRLSGRNPRRRGLWRHRRRAGAA